jgi:hypothetical protein
MLSPLQKPVVEAGLPLDITTAEEDGNAPVFDLHPSSSKEAHITDGLSPQEAPQVSSNESISMSCLPPVDGGRQAWAYLLCATILETLVWG